MSTQNYDPHETAAVAGFTPTTGFAAPAPRGRPSWSGLLRVSLVAVPVKAYPAVSSTATSHFNQLHADCGERIRHEKRCPRHGPVDAAAIVRGYPYARDQYVVIDADALEKLRPAKDKALMLEQFVPAYRVDPTFFAGRSLYLLPDGLAAQHPYGVMAEALRQGNHWAVGRVVLSGHRQLVLVRPVGRLLTLDVLYFPAQVRAAAAWEAELRGSAATAEELQLAGTVIAAATGPLDWSRYRDTTAEELAALVEAKIANRPATVPVEESGTVLRLLDALKQSVAAARNRPGAPLVKPRQPRGQRRAGA